MKLHKPVRSMLLIVIAMACLAAVSPTLAQTDNKPAVTEKKDDETNLDTQLYLVVGTNQDVEDARLPASLDPVIKTLRSALPFKNYRLAATLINRVKSEGRLSLKWIGDPLLAQTASTKSTPSFNEFNVHSVRFLDDGSGHKIIRMDGFNFGARIPIATYNGVASNGGAPPVVNYEPTGLTTDISMREGEPVVVGTLNIGPSGDAIILVMSAKRTLK